jgi:hypothetical protein
VGFRLTESISGVLVPKESVRRNIGIIASGFMLLVGFNSKKSYAEAWMNKLARNGQALLEAVVAENDPALSYLMLTHSRKLRNRSDTVRTLEQQAYEQAAQGFQLNGEGYNGIDVKLCPWDNVDEKITSDMSIWWFWQILNQYWQHRAFVVTEGGYMGFAQPGTRKGDRVCILHGCRIPLIIRPAMEGNEYVLVGDAYFHGMMKGEMVKKQEKGALKLEDLTFR